ncbi:MAG: S-layer homology domain-containing protein [Ignavibacteriales bacterium]
MLFEVVSRHLSDISHLGQTKLGQIKRILVLLFTCALVFLFALPAVAFTGYEPGVTDTKEYREIVMLGGKPVVYTGTVKASSKVKKDITQTTLTYKLTGGSGESLTRSVKLESLLATRDKQDVYETKMVALTETVQVGSVKLKLKKEGGYYFSGSKVVDHRPIIDFSTENWYMKKIYEVGKVGYLTVETTGTSEGYANAWGKGNTRTISMQIQRTGGGTDIPDWGGSADIVMNDNFGRTLRYVASQPQLISYAGGFLDEGRIEESLKINYDLPTVAADGTVDNSGRTSNSTTASMTSPPTERRLFIAEFKDVRNHWARQAIEAMCGLGVFDNKGSYFGPGYAARRVDLARGISVIAELAKEPVKKTTTRKVVAETPMFVDVPAAHPDFKHVQAIAKAGIDLGESEMVFKPSAQLTRAEAAVALVSALGLHRLAPSGEYQTSFLDNGDIPLGAKDSVFIANEIGLMKGDQGYFRPMDTMTRAELASLLDAFRGYLNRDFKQDYREHVYSFK